MYMTLCMFLCITTQCAKLQPIDLSMSVVKPLGATWMMNTSEYIKANVSIIITVQEFVNLHYLPVQGL